MRKPLFPSLRSSALAATASLALAGCSLTPTYERPVTPVPQTIPGAGAANAAAAQLPPAAETGWQDYYTDPRLQQLIRIALDNNRDLRVAARRHVPSTGCSAPTCCPAWVRGPR